jgi:hypothetical protein
MVGRILRISAALLLSAAVFTGCAPEQTLTAEDITVQVPTGDGQAAPIDNSEWLNADPPDTTPYGPFDASGINVAALAGSSGGGGGGGGGSGSADDSDIPAAMLRVSGAVLYSGNVSGTDHQILEGGYPEIHQTKSGFVTVGVDEAMLPIGLSLPGFAGLSSYAIDVTPVDEQVEYTGTSAPLGMDYTYKVTPRVWSADGTGFHGEFDINMLAVAPNGFEMRGNATHTVDGTWSGAALTYSSTTAYHCELALDRESILFVAHQTLGFAGVLRREN